MAKFSTFESAGNDHTTIDARTEHRRHDQSDTLPEVDRRTARLPAHRSGKRAQRQAPAVLTTEALLQDRLAPSLTPNLTPSLAPSPSIQAPPVQAPPTSAPHPITDRGRMYLVIDGTSLFYGMSQLGLDVDYTKLLAELTQGGRLIRALFYTGIDPTNEKQKGFLHWMRNHGFRVVQKEITRLPDGTRKANLDVEMAIDMMQFAKHCDTIMLVSGNGELAYALDHASRQGARVEVVSLKAMLSDRLQDVCDRYTDLADIQDRIGIRRSAPSSS
jgi:uncharacterized LabA/DUF88 family protein